MSNGAVSDQERADAEAAVAKARAQLAATQAIIDALEPLETNAARLRVLAAVATLHGLGCEAREALRAAERLEAQR